MIHVVDASNLRVTEEREAGVLTDDSYYWWPTIIASRSAGTTPRITRSCSFPDHKRVGQQTDRQPSAEASLEAVMQDIVPQLSPSGV